MDYIGMYLSIATVGCIVFSVFFKVPFVFSSILIVLTLNSFTSVWFTFFIAVVFLFLNVPFLRCYCISAPIKWLMVSLNFLPAISKTEQEAIEAGDVWVDGELFSGKPNFDKILNHPHANLTEDELSFLEGPVNKLCDMVCEWELYQNKDFSQEIWNFMKKEKFFGMIIPKKYGGLAFSAKAHSDVVTKLSSRSTALGITVMVPNSLGPAELLIHYGTESQKQHYLPKLAIGEEIPCFALTEAEAGSDAGAISSEGVVYKGENGNVMIRLNWKKRYITLGSVATVIGLAFRLKDPDNILEFGKKNLGITCALISHKTEGIVAGFRHDPLGVPFYNCPLEGHDVSVGIDAVIGGLDGIGKGWRMLMESLSVGRGISLPSNCSGGAKLVTAVTTSYVTFRKQFGLAIGKFEGVQEKLAEIVGFTYIIDAMRHFTCSGIDAGVKPAIVTAIVKYHSTELFRKVIANGMDILGGAGISLGKRNLLARMYFSAPIGVTVEGANILTRTLMIFGQGVVRCHPHVLSEIDAIKTGNLQAFDKAFFSHLSHVVTTFIRSKILFLTRGGLAKSSSNHDLSKYCKRLSWVSSQFAFLSDISMALLGGKLKQREMLSGAFSDIFSWMYIATSILYYATFNVPSHKSERRAFDWSMEYSFYEIQKGFTAILSNLGGIFKVGSILYDLNKVGSYPSYNLSKKLARSAQRPSKLRKLLLDGLYIPSEDTETLARYEKLFASMYDVQFLYKKVETAISSGVLLKEDTFLDQVKTASEKGILSKEEGDRLLYVETLRYDAIQVDKFPLTKSE